VTRASHESSTQTFEAKTNGADANYSSLATQRSLQGRFRTGIFTPEISSGAIRSGGARGGSLARHRDKPRGKRFERLGLRLAFEFQSRTHCPRSRMASYIASGARSAPFGHWTAPNTTWAWAKIAGSRSGSKTVPSIFELLRNDFIWTSPAAPSTKTTCKQASGNVVTDDTRHGTVCFIAGSISAVRLMPIKLLRSRYGLRLTLCPFLESPTFLGDDTARRCCEANRKSSSEFSSTAVRSRGSRCRRLARHGDEPYGEGSERHHSSRGFTQDAQFLGNGTNRDRHQAADF